MSKFSKPASSSGIQWEDLKGSLLIVEPTSLETGIQTRYGESDAVKATVTVVDGDNAGTVYTDTLIFPRVLQKAVKGKLGEIVLGRLGTGVAKPKQSPPWVLEDFTSADATLAEKVLDERGPAPATAVDEKADLPF